MMIGSIEKYRDLVKGEVSIIYDEVRKFHQHQSANIVTVSDFWEDIRPHLASIECKIGINSIDYIRITTEIVDVICDWVIANTNIDNTIDELSTLETIKFYENQRKHLIETLDIFRKLEKLNMDYAYRIRVFNKTKEKIENRCHEKGIDIRTVTQKSVDRIKEVGYFTGVIAKVTAGCAFEFGIKIAIVLAIFFILRFILV